MSEQMTNNILYSQHQKLLDDSAISPEIVKARGYRSVNNKAELRRLGFGDRQCRVPALLIPVWNAAGEIASYQVRADEPRMNGRGKPVKYETPQGSHMVLDVPPSAIKWIGDPSVPLVVTEGIRKADAAVSKGLCCVALLGVWNWRGSNDAGGKVALPDWECVALNDRTIYICFDSDVMFKIEVHNAMVRFKEFLSSRGSHVNLIYLPSGAQGQKVGLDDFLAAEHSVEELFKLASSTVNSLPTTDTDYLDVPYRATDRGLVWVKSGSQETSTIPLTNFTAQIVTEVSKDDGIETKRVFEIEAIMGERRQTFSVDSSQFAGMTWVIKNIGAMAIVYPGMNLKEHARTAIQCLSGIIPKRIVYTHIGWRKINGEWIYLHAGGGIGACGSISGMEVELPDAISKFILPTPTTSSKLQCAVKASLQTLEVAPLIISVPLLASTYLATIGRPDFSIHLVGSTGCGKSELAALVQQHWGPGLNSRHLPGSWSSTANALEALAFVAKDAVLVVDDFAPTGTSVDVARSHREADRILRAQGNASGRQRMNADTSLKSAKPPRGLILSTGEDTPRGQSLRARMVVIEVGTDSVHWDRLAACQKAAANGLFAEAMAGYVKWSARCHDEMLDRFTREMISLREKSDFDGSHKRVSHNLLALEISLRLFLDFAVEVGAIQVSKANVVHEQGRKVLRALADAQAGHQAASEPARRFLDLLRASLSSGRCHIAGPRGDAPDSPEVWGWHRVNNDGNEWGPNGSCIGWVDGCNVYLVPLAAFATAQQMGRDDEALTIAPRTLHKRLQEQGLLASTDKTRNTYTIRKVLQGARRDVLHIHTQTIMLQETDQTAQSDHAKYLHEGFHGDSGQFDGQFEGLILPETDQGNCPKLPDSLSATDLVGSLVSSCAQENGNCSQEGLVQEILQALSGKPVPIEVGLGQKIANVAGYAASESRSALSSSPIISRPARERLATIGVVVSIQPKQVCLNNE